MTGYWCVHCLGREAALAEGRRLCQAVRVRSLSRPARSTSSRPTLSTRLTTVL